MVRMTVEIGVDHTKSEEEQEKEREKNWETILNHQYVGPNYPYNQYLPPGLMS